MANQANLQIAVSCSCKVIKMKANHNDNNFCTFGNVAVSCSCKVIKMKANHNIPLSAIMVSCAVSCSCKVIKMKANHNNFAGRMQFQRLFLVVAKLLK